MSAGDPATPVRAAKKGQIDGLTSLRFFAAFAVVLFHTGPAIHIAGADSLRFAWLGSAGVGLFYVLSGFILYYVYAAALYSGTFSFSDFLTARFARVVPVYVFGLLLAFPGFLHRLLPSLHSAGSAWWADSNLYALLTAPVLLQAWYPSTACVWNCPGWSLSAEAFFYLCFPVIAVWAMTLAGRRLRLSLVAVYAVGLVPASLYWLSDLPVPHFGGEPVEAASLLKVVWYNPALRLPEFAFGVLIGRMFFDEGFRLRAWQAGIASIVAGALLYQPYSLPDRPSMTLLQVGLFAPLFGLLVCAIAQNASGLTGPLRSSALVRLGEASYALYIVHVPVWGIFNYLSRSGRLPDVHEPLVYAAFIATVITLSLAVYRWIEVPCRRYIRNRGTRPRTQMDAAAADDTFHSRGTRGRCRAGGVAGPISPEGAWPS